MRLHSIKLSGFKSFADPTHFTLPGQLVGVVGPNGCGKSNIMDAVRWVLGESKASELRGESMQDVIFSGTTTRKQASRASVELVFDNTDHRAGGQWGQYAEIAVKRVLTRDGASQYYLNNQVVRRRDVQDVFLGTGLGPRAYAIIGQGTISRIIESRPEDLRLFLEEAAGVSKYKERRRETENRFVDTRENLTRVEDILRELNAQLERLEKQAEVAQKYHALQASVALKQHQQWFLKRADAQSEQAQAHTEGLQAINDLESRIAQMRHTEAEQEALRQAHYAAGDHVNQAQGKLYEATAEVGRLEAEIRYVLEGRQRVQHRLIALSEQMAQWLARREEAQIDLENLTGTGVDAQEQAEWLAAQVEEHATQSPDLEEALHQAQSHANAQRMVVVQVQQQIQVLAAEQRSMREQSHQLQSRHERLSAQHNALTPPDAACLLDLHGQLEAAEESLEIMQARWAEMQDAAPHLDEERRHCQQLVNTESAHEAALSARAEALKAVQEKLKTDGKLQPWLARHGLEGLPALWSRIHIQTGWESALEAALRERLMALQVGSLDHVDGFLGDVPPAKVAFFSPPSSLDDSINLVNLPNLPNLPKLVDLLCWDGVEGVSNLQGFQGVLADWLEGCYTALTLHDALGQRHLLLPGDAIYLPEGHAVTAHSVGFYAQDSESLGLLARAQEIEQLGTALHTQALITHESRTALARAEAAYADAAQRLTTVGHEAAQAQNNAHTLQVEYLRLSQQAAQTQARSAQIGSDLAEVEAQLHALQERSTEAEARLEALDAELADAQERHRQQEDWATEAKRNVDACREQQHSLERQMQEALFAQRSMQARQAELSRTLATADQQTTSLADEILRAQAELARLSDAAAQGGLQEVLALKVECEKNLAAQRSGYDDLSLRLRAYDEQRVQQERSLEPLRERVTQFQLKEQAARLGTEQYTTLLVEAEANLEDVAQSIAQDNVRVTGLQAEIDRLHRESATLGAVNLAALEELTAATERKTFLDAQMADLTDAINTLEEAIRKIDAETRALLSGTFETVNGHFGRMFPELFGGGNARLIITGDEILNSGVQVMAQPPGKKNQTIHLLSGGEKALTAIALVFAIFQLNPAPFCLLDEVDAPLDDANTERYAKLVSGMSRETQFLFISHNKIAIEMAKQLIGVTMQEQGVSRIVAVDMESALSMVDTGVA